MEKGFEQFTEEKTQIANKPVKRAIFLVIRKMQVDVPIFQFFHSTICQKLRSSTKPQC
jgi:hypothetical protein